MGNKLIAFLGDGRNYQESYFAVRPKGKIEDIKFKIFTSSIIAWLRKQNVQIDNIIFIGTDVSFKTCKEHIDKEVINTLGISDSSIFYVTIDENQMKTEQLRVFISEILKQFSKYLSDGDVVYMDTTHSFRFMPFIASVLSLYLKTVFKNLNLRLYYGLFENDSLTTNLIDLSYLNEIIEWIYAAKLFMNFGYTSPFSYLLTNKSAEIYKNSNTKEKPKKIKGLSTTFDKFSTAIRAGIWSSIDESIDNLIQKFNDRELVKEVEKFIPEMSPIFFKIVEKVKNLDTDKLERQRRLIIFYIDSGDLGMAYRLAREYIISCGIYALGKPESLYDRDEREKISKLLSESIKQEKLEQISSIFQIRNVFAHFGFNEDSKNVRLDEAREKLKKFVKEYDSAEKLIEFLKKILGQE
ncbi:MAG: CRISPR-associated DxTHG motif protein [Fervidobacterium sp.]|nr:CRISPR-associated DxTHG motif protein [Fervidobacterium sp.]